MMKKIGRLAVVFLLAVSVCVVPAAAADAENAFPEAAANTNSPLVYLSDLEGETGDTLTATVAFANAAGLMSADLVIQYNPYMLEYEGFEPSASMLGSNIYIQYTEQTGPDVTDIYGNIAHEVYISLIHMEQFPSTLDTCSVGTVSFKAVGGGECPLEVTVMSYETKDGYVDPVVISGTASIEGEIASTWDYTAITSSEVTVPADGQYQVKTTRQIPNWMKIALILAALIVVGLVILFIAKGKSIVADEDELTPIDDAPASGDTPASGDAENAQDKT